MILTVATTPEKGVASFAFLQLTFIYEPGLTQHCDMDVLSANSLATSNVHLSGLSALVLSLSVRTFRVAMISDVTFVFILNF